jgi:hypothetical protein
MFKGFSMNRFALLLVLAVSLPLAAQQPAQTVSQPAQTAPDALHLKAQKMVLLLHTDRTVDGVTANIKKQVLAAAEKEVGPNPTAEKKARLEIFEKKVAQLIDEQVGWKAMQSTFFDMYAKTFTEQELDGIIAFYQSPSGIALLDKMQGLDAQANQYAQSRLIAAQPQLKQLFEDFRKSSDAPSPAAPVATPAPAATTSAPVAASPVTSPAK